MTRRPKVLSALSAILWIATIALPLQIMIQFQIYPWEFQAIASKLAPLNWILIFVCPITAWLSWRASPYLIQALPILAALILYNNFLVAEYGTNAPVGGIVFMTAAVLLVGLRLIFRHDVLNLLLNPNRRWWLTPARHRVKLPVSLQVVEKSVAELTANSLDLTQTGAGIAVQVVEESSSLRYDLQTFDISKGGAFLVCGQEFTSLSIGTECLVQFSLEDAKNDEAIVCRAEVVRHAPAQGRYPSGVGIRFVDLNWQDLRRLEGLLKDMDGPALGRS